MSEEEKRRRPRSRSRSRTRLTSRVNFFETVWSSPPADIMVIQPQRPENVEMTQDQADELERQMRQRRRQASATIGHAVTLRRVVSPIRPVDSTSQVFVSSWADNQSRSPDGQQQQQQPPWRLAQRSEPPVETGHQVDSSFSPNTSPTLALNKYQEWRASRFSSSEQSEQPVAPWRKSRSGSSSTEASITSPTYSLPPSTSSGRSGGVRSASVPQHPHTGAWYNEFRSASMSQTAARFDLFRGGDFAASMNSHYDFHIAEIKGKQSTGPIDQRPIRTAACG